MEQGQINAAKAGDREAFLSLLEPWEDKLYQTALGIVGNKFDAEDVWQNTVLKAWIKIGGLRKPVFRTWITRILINEARQHLRRKGKLPIPLEHLPDSGAGDPDVAVKILVHGCLQQLTQEHRQAVVLRYWLDMTLEEIARVLGVPLSTAKTRLYQGRAKLKDLLKEADLYERMG